MHSSVDDDIAAIFDPYGNATHAALSFDTVGEDVLITGAGPIGCMAAAICRHNGARNVVVTDVNDFRLALAQRLGADRTSSTSRCEDLKATLWTSSAWSAASTWGSRCPGARRPSPRCSTRCITAGEWPCSASSPTARRIDWDKVIFKGLYVKGIYGREIFETWYKMEAMIRSHLDIGPVITHRFVFDDFQKGFDAMLSGESGKVILSLD